MSIQPILIPAIGECSRLPASYEIAGITCAKESVYATVGRLCRYFDQPGPNPHQLNDVATIQRHLLAEASLPVAKVIVAER